MADGRLDEILAPRIVAATPPRIAVLDIERLPGTAAVPFWDLGDFKNRRIHADHVTEWPRTICAAWRWYGNKRIEFAAEWADPDGFLKTLWDVYNTADILVGHNIDRFDTRKLAGEWHMRGLPKPAPWKSVDTLKVYRSQFALESNTLDAIAKRLGIQGKVDRYDPDVAREAVAGNPRAQRRIRTYNQGDIRTTEAVYDLVRPWIPNHPHIGLYSGEDGCCGNCGGQLNPCDWYRTPVTAYAQYQCGNCRAWFRRNDIKARTTTRPAR